MAPRRRHPPLSRLRLDGKRLEYLGYRAGAQAVESLPGALVSPGAGLVSVVLRSAMRGRRAMVARHLQRVHGGDLQGEALDRAVRRTFDSYARYWLSLFRLPSLDPAEIDAGLRVEGMEHLDDALAGESGVILALPHLGSWDFGGAWFGLRGYPCTVVVEPLEPPELFHWFATRREAMGLKIVPLGPEAGPALLRALRRNEVVGLLCDRDITGGGVEVEFFGERTTLPAGPATLALRTGAPLLPTAVYDEPNGMHLAIVRPPVPTERTGRLRVDVARVTQLLADELEDLIRCAPEQWHLMQPNWPSDHDA